MDWQLIALIVLAVLLLIAGGWIKRLTKEVKDLVDVVVLAIEDNELTRKEIIAIIREAEDVGRVAAQILRLISRRM